MFAKTICHRKLFFIFSNIKNVLVNEKNVEFLHRMSSGDMDKWEIISILYDLTDPIYYVFEIIVKTKLLKNADT